MFLEFGRNQRIQLFSLLGFPHWVEIEMELAEPGLKPQSSDSKSGTGCCLGCYFFCCC